MVIAIYQAEFQAFPWIILVKSRIIITRIL